MTQVKKQTVSVVIPFYNGSKWIERAIESVLSQTVKPKEIIIVNDGSLSNERIALKKIQDKYDFIIIDQENSGQGGARNTGVEASSSEWICFLDQDDYFLPEHISDLLNTIPSTDPLVGFAYGDFRHADIDGNTINTSCLVSLQPANHPKKGHIKDIISTDLMITPSSTIIKKSIFEKLGGFDPQFKGYEDDDLFLRFFRAGYSNYFIPKPVYVWCMHGDSTSWSITMSRSRLLYFKKLVLTYKDDHFNGLLYLKDHLRPRFEKSFISEAVKARKANHQNSHEFISILKEYVKIVNENSNTSKKIKRKLTRIIRIVEFSPPLFFKLSKTIRKAMR